MRELVVVRPRELDVQSRSPIRPWVVEIVSASGEPLAVSYHSDYRTAKQHADRLRDQARGSAD